MKRKNISKEIKMAKEHLSLKPHNLSEKVWWYDNMKGIEIVVAHFDSKVNTEIVVIPWRSIKAALKRKDKLKGA